MPCEVRPSSRDHRASPFIYRALTTGTESVTVSQVFTWLNRESISQCEVRFAYCSDRQIEVVQLRDFMRPTNVANLRYVIAQLNEVNETNT